MTERAGFAQASKRRMCPTRFGSRPVVRLRASPGRSCSFEIACETFQIESVEYRSTPQARLSQAEQSIPVFVELPPHTYGMFSIDAARDRISPRIARDGSATAASKTGAGRVGSSIASGPFAFVGSALNVASDERSGTRPSPPGGRPNGDSPFVVRPLIREERGRVDVLDVPRRENRRRLRRHPTQQKGKHSRDSQKGGAGHRRRAT